MKLVFCLGLAAGLVGAALQAQGAEGRDKLWELRLGQRIDSSPAVGADGTIYVTVCGYVNYADVSGGKLVAVSPGGSKKWDFRIPMEIKSSPALGADGTIYFGARDRNFYAIAGDGKKKWSFATGAWVDSSAAISTDGTVYFGGWDKKFYALNADGSKRWEFATGGPIDSSPAIGQDGTVYFGSHDGRFYALNPDGSVKWKFPTGGAIISSPALDATGNIFFTSVDGKLYALNAEGSQRWATWTGGTEESSPVLDAEGNIYIGVNNTNMFLAFKPDGTKKWGFGYPEIKGTAAVSADGKIFFTGKNDGAGLLYEFNSSGVLQMATFMGSESAGSPVIAPDGTIYIGAYLLRAYKGTSGPAKSCWSKFRGGLSQTGRVDFN